MTVATSATTRPPDPYTTLLDATHEGTEWLYVLTGRMRLIVGERDLVLKAGEVAEFDTRLPHWFGSDGEIEAEILSIFGPQGERVHAGTS